MSLSLCQICGCNIKYCCLQGDKEAALGLQFSPLCDRKSTLVAQSQIGNDKSCFSFSCMCRSMQNHVGISYTSVNCRCSKCFYIEDISLQLFTKLICFYSRNVLVSKEHEVISACVMPKKGKRGINQSTGREPNVYCTQCRVWEIVSSDSLTLGQELTGLSFL